MTITEEIVMVPVPRSRLMEVYRLLGQQLTPPPRTEDQPSDSLTRLVRDSSKQASWENLHLVVPWMNLGLVFLIVYVVALAATFAPALRASRVRPAEALRYQ